MSQLIQLLKTRRFPILVLAIILLGILTGAVLGWTGKAQKQAPKVAAPKVTSKVPAVQVVSAEPTAIGTSNVLVVKLKNTSDRDIKAFTISSGRGLMTSNYFLTEESFAAGTTIDKIIPLSLDANYRLPMGGKEVAVAAVFFADGTGDGLSTYVTSMSDVYEGTREQANVFCHACKGFL